MLETIKSYLVSLGFAVNDQEFNKVQSTMNNLDKTITGVTSGMAKQFAVASTEIVSALTAVSAATGALIKNTADADMGYQKFALSMWMTKDSAKNLQVTLKAMGESVEDIAWIPELRQQYFELINLGNQMKTPGDAGEQLKYIRSILFEFKKLKLEISYASEWISYYLIKYLSEPLAKAKQSLQDFNAIIIQKMPQWTNTVAKILSAIVMVAINAGRFIGDVFTGFQKIFDLMPRGMRIAILSIAGITAAMKISPLFMMLTTAILLIDDFYAYVDGRKSLPILAPVWGKVIEWTKILNKKIEELKPVVQELWDKIVLWFDDFRKRLFDAWQQMKLLWSEFEKSDTYKNTIDALKNSFEGLKEGILAARNILAEFFGALGKSMEKKGVVTQFNETMDAISGTISAVTNAIKELMIQLHLFSSDSKTKTFMQWFTDELAREVKLVLLLVETIAHLISALARAATGDKKGAVKELQAAAKSGVAAGKAFAGTDATERGGESSPEVGRDIAKKVSDINGLPANLIYGQMAHETANFTDLSAPNNFGGLKTESGAYMAFDSPDAFAKYYAWYLKQYDENGISQATTPEEWAHALKKGGYYEDAESTYAAGIRAFSQEYSPPDVSFDYDDNSPISLSKAAALRNTAFTGMNTLQGSYTTPISTNVSADTGNGGVYVDNINLSFGGTTASPDELKQAAIEGVKKGSGRSIALQTRDLQGVMI